MTGVEPLTFGGMLVLGLLGSSHCMVMCGGIACAAGLSVGNSRAHRPSRLRWAVSIAAYQAGRVCGYALVGALAAATLAVVLQASGSHRVTVIAHVVQALTLVVMGCYLLGVWRFPVMALEALGGRVFAKLSPVTAKLLPVEHPLQALGFGLLWGGLPCPLVYGALALAAAAGEPVRAALYMLAFGIGTAPAVLGVSVLGRGLAGASRLQGLRRVVGLALLGVGIVVASAVFTH